MTLILGIETSCDETAAAVVNDGVDILSDIVASQISIHAEFGGVFPEIASRAHVEQIYPVVNAALKDAGVTIAEIDGIAVTQGPGLAGSLVVGVNMAKGLAIASGKKLITVNHLEGHIHSLWLNSEIFSNGAGIETNRKIITFPVVILIVSGGHTSLILMREHGVYEIIGQTLDDAAGEAFDKVGRLLGLPYPGGPSIQRAASRGNPEAFVMPRAWLKTDAGEQSYDFSFSGLKTAMLRTLESLQPGYHPNSPLHSHIPIDDLAASFQAAAVDVLVTKTIRAAKAFNAKEILIAGGVSANLSLRNALVSASLVPVRIPPLAFCTDNAVMVASAGYFKAARFEFSPLTCDVLPNLPLSVFKATHPH